MKCILILGNQLFDPSHFERLGVDRNSTIIFMREDRELASYYRFHKHKIIFFFAAMRCYRDELIQAGYRVCYQEIKSNAKENYDEALTEFIHQHSIRELSRFEIEDKFFEERMNNLTRDLKIGVTIWASPMFLTSRSDFKQYLTNSRKPFMKTFYQFQRKRLQILMQANEPIGGKWSFDEDNRRSLPKTISPPSLPIASANPTVEVVKDVVTEIFSEHPGQVTNFWLPVTRSGAKNWLKDFLQQRLEHFGPYEDALPAHSTFVYHSVLTPFLNSGLLTPNEIVSETLRYADQRNIPLSSLEGFVRQIIGWREFIRGIYQNYSEQQQTANFWNHQQRLSKLWWQGGTGIPSVDRAIQRVLERGYLHHIERLMVVGSLFVLLEISPHEAHRWFMELFIDSSDWVMGPNVYGMALFSDGGLFATKPYICGSNYLRKMGGDKAGDWCDGVDGLYWQFIVKHRRFFTQNPRLSMMVRSAEKILSARWQKLEQAANELRARLIAAPQC